MYAVYKQAHPPTGLEFSMYCNFFNNSERNLVVAGTSQLYVYRLNRDAEAPAKNDRSTEGKAHREHREKLELVASFSFFGNVMSMASVQLAGAKRDALLLSFKDAKLSVVEYDPGTHDLKTLSLHYFEEPELRDGFVQNVHTPRVRVDPDGRCAAMLIYGTRLVVLPFRRESLAEEHEGLMGEGQRSSFLPSYIIDVRALDEKLLNIVDLQFLHGYYEPTLLILFEPNQTWPGRVAVRQDTCSIVAISLNITQKVHPVIWSLTSLPFDCTQALAVPKPIGGVVVFAVNSLLYLNQSVPPYGVALNSLTSGTTAFPLRTQEGVRITLDCAQAAFISYDKMVISLKGGEIYVLTLITDGMRSVRAFHFDKAAASVLTGSMVTMEPGYLFLGSRLGNSLLLKYTEKLQEAPASTVREAADKEEPLSKKKRVDSTVSWSGGQSVPQDEVDEIEVYGSEAQSGTQLATYSFEVCDSILNIGPCANAAMGEPAFLSEEFQNSPEPDLEIVMCSGYGKNGALSVLQKSIRPQVVTTFELPGCYDMWTVVAPVRKEQEEAPKGEGAEQEPSTPETEDDGRRHGFLILSREDSTMILQTGQEIMELDTSGFATQGPTVFAGNIGDNRYIVQVSPLGIRLLEGVNQLHFIPVDLGSPIVQCAVADPYVVIMSAEGHVTMFLLKSDSYGGRHHRLALHKPPLHHQSKVIAMCVYRDVSGMFTTESRLGGARDELGGRSGSEAEGQGSETSPTVDDEEEMLYGAGARGRVARFRYFEDIYGYSGVFICGPSPHWLLVTGRGALRLHPMGIDGPIDSFAPFHNVNCPRGFLYFNRQGELRISVLPAYLSYDAPWPVRKIPLRCTAHYVAYHVESKVYAVATSTNTPCTRIPRMTGEEKEFETIERDDRYIHPQQEAFSIQLISPVSWEAIPNARIELEEWEHVTCMKTVSLRSEETVSGLKGYVAAGTCLMQGEEVTCRGRILIMDVIEVVPEPGQPLTKNKFKVLYEKEQKGPVTALCHCNGHLVSAIGQKIFLWSLRASELTGMAFIDTQLYIHQMISVKNFILAADVMKSISLLRYQEDSKTLSLVSRDAKPLEVYSVDFMVDNAQLGFLVSDRDRNLMVYMYLPEAKESFGGMRLLRRADFHVGAHVNTFWRTPCRGAAEGPSKKSVVWENKHITWFATLDGGIGLLLPMQEKTYRRLLMLQNALTTMLPHHAGLNPRAFRMLHVDRRTLQNAVRNILDGELLNRYLYLSTMERSELAKKIGTTPDIILDDLLETDRVTAHF
uniref:Cleavage and polyadenylation specificity factor subunit 1 n=1 Tax=Molossus molossus TaxID=27622 RepID=A0A7J8BA83_MOLMO|nr:cleavage and polyadenylation specific factor 1 [Molossus molossus]